MMKTDIFNILNNLRNQNYGELKRINTNSKLAACFGLNKNGQLRLSFLSSLKPPKFEATKNIGIAQGTDAANTNWLNFDLLVQGQENVFLSFCENLVESISYTNTEEQAFSALKKQYAKWKALFKKNSDGDIPKDVVQGLYGELYFLKNFMSPKYGVNRAVRAWSGAEGTSKDFAIDEIWYEVKTIGNKTPVAKINSLAQLESDHEGRLVINRIEQMADEYSSDDDCIKKIFDSIREKIDDETVENDFFEKISETGVAANDKAMEMKFSVHSTTFYKVDDVFPKLTRGNVPFQEICDVQYALSVDSLKPYEVAFDD